MDRLIQKFRALVRKEIEDLLCLRTMPYVVVACNAPAQTASLRSLDSSMPDLTDVSLRAPGLALNLPPGTAVSVAVDTVGVPYVQSYASGGIPSLVPDAGSGIQNNIDAGYILLIQAPVTPFAVLATYFPAGVAGGLAADIAHTAAPGSILLHLNGGRVFPDAWTVP